LWDDVQLLVAIKEMSEDKSSKDNPPTGWAAFAIGIGGVLIAIVLRVSGLIPHWSVVVLIAVFALVAVAVHAFPRLEELNLRQLSIRLREVKAAEERIYAKEQSVQELMLTLADLSVMDSLNVGRLVGKTPRSNAKMEGKTA
jgi:hypothetical protein